MNNNMNELRGPYASEISQRKIITILSHMWNLKIKQNTEVIGRKNRLEVGSGDQIKTN